MAITEFEFLGELEDELEEEARELELIFPRRRLGTMMPTCLDVSGRCISVSCRWPYKCVRRLLSGCECRPGRFPIPPGIRDPQPSPAELKAALASGRCIKRLGRYGNYLVCCPGTYPSPDCKVYPMPSWAKDYELEQEAEEELPLDLHLELDLGFDQENLDGGGELDLPELENPAKKADARRKLNNFYQDVTSNPKNYKDLLLTARLHPCPMAIGFLSANSKDTLIDLAMTGYGMGDPTINILTELTNKLKPYADSKFGREVKDEAQLALRANNTLMNQLARDPKKFKDITREAALLDPNDPQYKDGCLTSDFSRLGELLDAKLNLGLAAISKYPSAYLVRLGRAFADTPVVDKERRKLQQQKRKRRP
jgi:hypothetical protein